MKKKVMSRLLAFLLALVMLFGETLPVLAENPDVSDNSDSAIEYVDFKEIDSVNVREDVSDNESSEEVEAEPYSATDVVRVSIVLEKEATLFAGYSSENIAKNSAAMNYRNDLRKNQDSVTAAIEKATGSTLNVKWNLTLAANIISAEVVYGDIETIKAVSGVKDVFVENLYVPMEETEEADSPKMAVSTYMIGSGYAYANGYYGGGAKVAIIDTGLDLDHQSFDNDAYNYAMGLVAQENGSTLSAYKEEVGVLTKNDVISALPNLNNPTLSADKLYVSDKVPFAYNYVDSDYDVTHDNDGQGEHGSHVAGISAANRYIASGENYANALTEVFTQGVAPDAQIVVMKVFGKHGGAYDSDYMVAIEDAIILDCDSINLSLGSSNPGFAHSNGYENIMKNLENCNSVVAIAAGNASSWNAEGSNIVDDTIYIDDASMSTLGSPGSFTNAFTVASADNKGQIGTPFYFGDEMVFFTETQDENYSNPPISTIAGEHDYVLLDGNYGVDGNGVDTIDQYKDIVAGKVVMVYRGQSSFYQKLNAAGKAGAIACIVINNQAGNISMNLTGSTAAIPCVSITQADGELIKYLSDKNGSVYTGTFTISDSLAATYDEYGYAKISSFSSWGIPGDLSMKPEITAPGGSIYSVDGSVAGGKAYELMSGTSMATPQVAGMAAILGQYIDENNLESKTGLTKRQLSTSLLMATAVPMWEDMGSGEIAYYPVIRQGSGLANIGYALDAKSYIIMDPSSTDSYADGKVKAELGDDPEKTGNYSWGFTVHNFSDDVVSYEPSTVLFTQSVRYDAYFDSFLMLDESTLPMWYNTYYTINGQRVELSSDNSVDLNYDGYSNVEDVQCILDVVSEKKTIPPELEDQYDIDYDGYVTTKDAKALLDSFSAGTFSLRPGEEAKIEVHVSLSDDDKDFLDNFYGTAYVEGYTFLKPTVSVEGAPCDVEYSIPVLGYYGSWTDASMFDRVDTWGVAYGSYDKYPYTENYLTNEMKVVYPESEEADWFLANPYNLKDANQFNRLSLGLDAVISSFNYTLIRNASLVVAALKDSQGKVIGYLSSPNLNVYGAFYNSSSGSWAYANPREYLVDYSPADLELNDGDTVTVGFYAIPEYYIKGENVWTEELLTSILENDVLGDGAKIEHTVKIDGVKPGISAIYKDYTTDKLVIEAEDNQYIAAIIISNATGSKLYAKTTPEQTTENEKVKVAFDLDSVYANGKVVVTVADYAGNERSYQINYMGEDEDFSGRMFAFTESEIGDTDPRFVEIDPEKLWGKKSTKSYTGEGVDTYLYSALDGITAAEYYDGYVYMATTYGFYVAPQTDLADISKVSSNSKYINDMAFNYADGNMYVLDDQNIVWTLDLLDGSLTKVAEIVASLPSSEDDAYINAMTIDDEGNFFFVNADDDANIYLYKTDLSKVSELKLTIAPVGENKLASTGVRVYNDTVATLAWDHDNDELYLATTYDEDGDLYNLLLTISVSTGKAALVNSTYPKNNNTATKSSLLDSMSGLYIVPTDGIVAKDATSVEISKTDITIYEGADFKLTAAVYPWALANKEVKWESSDTSIATVEAGIVHGVSAGNAKIVASSLVNPEVKAECNVVVNKPATPNVSGLVALSDGTPIWADMNTANPADINKIADGLFLRGGTKSGNYIFAMDTDALYVIYPSYNYQSQQLFELNTTYLMSDAAEIPTSLWEAFEGQIVAPFDSGSKLMILDAIEGNLNYWNLSSLFGSDPIAAIAYLGAGNANGETALFYFIITEKGTLGELYITASGNLNYMKIGDTGINLGKVSSAASESYASLLYDSVNDCLVLSNYNSSKDTAAKFYVIEANSACTVCVGTAAENVWPISCLHNLTQNTVSGLSVPEDAEMFDCGKAVKLENFNEIKASKEDSGEVIIESSDNNVANIPSGTLDSVTAEYNSDGVVLPGKEVTVIVKDSVDVTNGKYRVEYDDTQLEFINVEGLSQCSSVYGQSGYVNIAFAYEKAVKAGNPIAKLRFRVIGEDKPSNFIVDCSEKNDSLLLDESYVIASDGMWAISIPDQTYTGKAIKPSVTVYDGDKLLVNGKDYTVSYKNNTAVASSSSEKAPTVIIKGKGNYDGTIEKKFSILAIPVTDQDTVFVNYTGNPISVDSVVKVVVGGKTLKNGKDYELYNCYSVTKQVTVEGEGIYDCQIKGIGNYTGSAYIAIVVSKKTNASKLSVANISAQNYTGSAITPTPSIKYNNKVVSLDNFDISYLNNVNPGKATIIISAKGASDFIGYKIVNFDIKGTAISKAKLVEKLPAFTYDGMAKCPEIQLKNGAVELVKGKDYTVSYMNNVNAGTGYVVVTGAGGYTGTAKFSFKINTIDLSKNDNANLVSVNENKAITVEYAKGGATPEPVVKFNGIILTNKVDYSLSYSNNNKIGTTEDTKAPTVKVTFKKNIKGSVSVKFDIIKKDIAKTTTAVADVFASTKDNAWKQPVNKITVTDSNGKKLSAGTDYNKNVEYFLDEALTTPVTAKTLPANTPVYVKITGINSYEGYVVARYNVAGYDISKAKVDKINKSYTGSAITLSANEVRVEVGGVVLTPNVDYYISNEYKNNVNKGVASYTIIGKGNYAGKKTANFTILPKKFAEWLNSIVH